MQTKTRPQRQSALLSKRGAPSHLSTSSIAEHVLVPPAARAASDAAPDGGGLKTRRSKRGGEGRHNSFRLKRAPSQLPAPVDPMSSPGDTEVRV